MSKHVPVAFPSSSLLADFTGLCGCICGQRDRASLWIRQASQQLYVRHSWPAAFLRLVWTINLRENLLLLASIIANCWMFIYKPKSNTGKSFLQFQCFIVFDTPRLWGHVKKIWIFGSGLSILLYLEAWRIVVARFLRFHSSQGTVVMSVQWLPRPKACASK